MKNVNLFCLPYAGGSSSIYAPWRHYLDPSIELCSVELAGRGCKRSLSYDSIESLAGQIFEEVKMSFDAMPYALFGHSMGAVIIYELMRKIYSSKVQRPVHIFLSGRNPIHINNRRKLHNLPDEDFKNEIFKLGGMPKEFLEHKKIFDLFIPILKTDITVLENYIPRPFEEKWDIDVSVFNGSTDSEVEIKRSHEWQNYTTGDCFLYTFEGGHFFINEKMPQVINVVNNTLTNTYL